tara:strand:+ start:798 stop:977 length:180 start_codon:yes stop_codon:yes gene_type:complete
VRHLINNNKKEKKMEITNKDLKEIKNLVDDLGWEHQRMSSSGQESYEKLCKVLGWKFEG